jgi:hypothetical protein
MLTLFNEFSIFYNYFVLIIVKICYQFILINVKNYLIFLKYYIIYNKLKCIKDYDIH